VAENPFRAALVKDRTEWPWQGEVYPLRLDENCSGDL
jgi:hypothetical protein